MGQIKKPSSPNVRSCGGKSALADGTNSSLLAPNRSVFLLSPATQSGPPLSSTPLPLFRTAKHFHYGFRDTPSRGVDCEKKFLRYAATLTAFHLYFPNSNPSNSPSLRFPSLPPFADPPLSLFGLQICAANPPSRYIPFASRMERQFRYFLLFLFLLQIMAALAQKEKWEGSNSGRRVYFRVRAALARLGS